MGITARIRITLRRVRQASFRRLNQNIQTIHQQTGKNRLLLLGDMLWCAARYGVGYLDYHVFGFASNRGKNRKTYMTMNHNVAVTRLVNDTALYPLMNDKVKFMQTYGAFIGRQWTDLRQSGGEGLRALCADGGAVFVKPVDAFGGKGVERIVPDENTDFDLLAEQCVAGGQYLAEQAICQHPDLNALCPSSVNTLRIVTLVARGEARFMYALLRVGSGTGHVDNISSGGMYTLIGTDGTLEFPAFCDKTGLYYDKHPVTGTAFPGFSVPCFNEAVELCRKAAMVEPRLGYIGWDVAITPHGPVIVEGNVLPGYDMAQNARFHPDGKGLLPAFQAALGVSDIRKLAP